MANWTDGNFEACVAWALDGTWRHNCGVYAAVTLLPDALPGALCVAVLAVVLVACLLASVVGCALWACRCGWCGGEGEQAQAGGRGCRPLVYRTAVVCNALGLVACAAYATWGASGTVAGAVGGLRDSIKPHAAGFASEAADFADAAADAAGAYPGGDVWVLAARDVLRVFSTLAKDVASDADTAVAAVKWTYVAAWLSVAAGVAVVIAALANGHRLATPLLVLLVCVGGGAVGSVQVAVAASRTLAGSLCEDYGSAAAAIVDRHAAGYAGVQDVRALSSAMDAAYYNATCGMGCGAVAVAAPTPWFTADPARPHGNGTTSVVDDVAAALRDACAGYFDCRYDACDGTVTSVGELLEASLLRGGRGAADWGACGDACSIAACARTCRAGSGLAALAQRAAQGHARVAAGLAGVDAAARPVLEGAPLRELFADADFHAALCGGRGATSFRAALLAQVAATAAASILSVLTAAYALLTTACAAGTASPTTPYVVVGERTDASDDSLGCAVVVPLASHEEAPPRRARGKRKRRARGGASPAPLRLDLSTP